MHRWRRSVVAALGCALVLSGGVSVVVSVFASDVDQAAALDLEQGQGRPPALVLPASAAEGDRSRADDAGRHGPPPWAQGHGTQRQDKSLTQWMAMTPAQRKATMARLVHEHAAGMKEFSSCVAAGRQKCERPLPPGLAKRQ